MIGKPNPPVFRITVRYGLNAPVPIIQHQAAGEDSARKFLNEMDWNLAVRVEIEVQQAP
jgi:hypothetical protein